VSSSGNSVRIIITGTEQGSAALLSHRNVLFALPRARL